MRRFCFFLLFFLPLSLRAATPNPKPFHVEREEIRLLAVERLRGLSAGDPRVLVTAETRLRALYEDFQLSGGTPPVSLEENLSLLRRDCRNAYRLASVGRSPPPNPEAHRILLREWEKHQNDVSLLRDRIETEKNSEKSESQIYWDSRRDYNALKEDVIRRMIFNDPPGPKSLDRLLTEEEDKLLIFCEKGPKKTKNANILVLTPRDVHRLTPVDVQPYYKFLDKVPENTPLRSGEFIVPAKSRTVTLRDNAARLIFRPLIGEGVLYLGQTQETIRYGYMAISPDTPYYFENTGEVPLKIEYVGIKP